MGLIHRALRRLAAPLIRTRARGMTKLRTNTRGDVLDPEVAALISLQGIIPGGLVAPDIGTMRKDYRFQSMLAGSSPARVTTYDRTLAGMDARVHEPENPRGMLLYLHGGGWAVGDLDSHDSLTRRLAVEGERTVVALHYPLAPEHPWPGAIDRIADAFLALRSETSLPLAMGGDSAGGNLTTVVCMVLRDRGEEQPDLQLLIYPGLDPHLTGASHAEFAEGLILTGESIANYLSLYEPDPEDPLGCPLHHGDVRELAPAVITVAGFDPLRDEGIEYAAKLRDAGVPVTLVDEATLTHGYAQYDGLVAEASAAVSRIASYLRPSHR